MFYCQEGFAIYLETNLTNLVDRKLDLFHVVCAFC
jgi:hypothetical protein